MFDLKDVKMKLRMDTKKWSRFSDNVFHKNELMAFGLSRDHPPAWELILIYYKNYFKISLPIGC